MNRPTEAGAGRPREKATRFLLFFFVATVIGAHAVNNLRHVGLGIVYSFDRPIALHDRPFAFASLLLVDLLGSLSVLPFVYWGLRAFVRTARGQPASLPFTGPSVWARSRLAAQARPSEPRQAPSSPQLSAADRSAMRRILLGWSDLSAGDVSVLDAAMQQGDASIMTSAGCANDRLWRALVELGWARSGEVPENLAAIAPQTAIYQLTESGRRLLPGFRRRYDLVFGTSYAGGAGASGVSLADRFQ